jgi:hypothetical protein
VSANQSSAQVLLILPPKWLNDVTCRKCGTAKYTAERAVKDGNESCSDQRQLPQFGGRFRVALTWLNPENVAHRVLQKI